MTWLLEAAYVCTRESTRKRGVLPRPLVLLDRRRNIPTASSEPSEDPCKKSDEEERKTVD